MAENGSEAKKRLEVLGGGGWLDGARLCYSARCFCRCACCGGTAKDKNGESMLSAACEAGEVRLANLDETVQRHVPLAFTVAERKRAFRHVTLPTDLREDESEREEEDERVQSLALVLQKPRCEWSGMATWANVWPELVV